MDKFSWPGTDISTGITTFIFTYSLTHWLIHSMEQREAISHSASQEISRLLWKPNVHYRVKSTSTVPYPEQNSSYPHVLTLFP